MTDVPALRDAGLGAASSEAPSTARRNGDQRSMRVGGRRFERTIDEAAEALRAMFAQSSGGAPLSEPDGSRRRSLIGALLPHGRWSDVAPRVVAALEYAALAETVVLLAPNHAARGPRCVIASEGAFETPLGPVPIDRALAESIRALGGISEAPSAFLDDHAIETLLPFLFAAQPRLSIVPIALHGPPGPTAARVGIAIADSISSRGGGVSVIATSDLGHYAAGARVLSIANEIADAIAAIDGPALASAIERAGTIAEPGSPLIDVCGAAAIDALVVAVRALGASHGTVFSVDAQRVRDDVDASIGLGGVAFRST